MRRLSGVLLAGAILMLPAFSQITRSRRPRRRRRRRYTGDVALWASAVNAGQDGRLREGAWPR